MLGLAGEGVAEREPGGRERAAEAGGLEQELAGGVHVADEEVVAADGEPADGLLRPLPHQAVRHLEQLGHLAQVHQRGHVQRRAALVQRVLFQHPETRANSVGVATLFLFGFFS